jgi:integrase
LGSRGVQEMTPVPEQQKHLEALSTLLGAQGLDAADLLKAITALAAVKQQEQSTKDPKSGNKIFQDKLFLYPGSEDAYIFRYGTTKSKNYYLRIYCKETKQSYKKSLKTSSTEEAMVKARSIYAETYGKLSRGEKTKSLTTISLITLYLEREQRRISSLPKAGITQASFETKKQYLNVWRRYVDEELKMIETKLENIPAERTRDFKYWIERQEKQFYSDRKGYSADYINSIISEVLRMYKTVAVRDKYLSLTLLPQIDKAKAQPNTDPKRHILEVPEWEGLATYLRTNKYLKPEGSSKLEQVKRAIFREYMGIAYSTGMRPKEILGLKWKDVRVNITDTKENQKIYRIAEVRAENSKTGKKRSVNAPIARRLQRLEKAYRDIGMTKEPEDFIFRNPTWKRQNGNIPYKQPAFTKRLDAALNESGIQDELDKTGRRITLYSSRHFYTTLRLQNGLNIHLLAKQLGTSTAYIDQTYSHIQVELNTEKISQGMSLMKKLENL